MTTSVVATTRVSAPPRGGLRYIPTVAFGTDLVLVTFSVFAAILGREAHPVRQPCPPERRRLARPRRPGHDHRLGGGDLPARRLPPPGLRRRTRRVQAHGQRLAGRPRQPSASAATCSSSSSPAASSSSPSLIGIPVLVLGRCLLRRSIHRARSQVPCSTASSSPATRATSTRSPACSRREKWLGYNVVGALTPEPGERATTHSGIPLLGSSRSIAEIAIDAEADVVFLAGGAFDSAVDMRRLAWDLEHEDVAVVIAPSVTDVSSERVSVRPVGGMPLIHLEKPRSAEAVRRAKRTFDIVGSLGLLLFFSPGLRLRRLPGVAPRPRPDPVPPDPRRPRRQDLPLLEVPHDGHQRRGAPRRPAQAAGLRGRPVQDGERPARHASRQVAAPLLHRRAAPAGQRPHAAT